MLTSRRDSLVQKAAYSPEASDIFRVGQNVRVEYLVKGMATDDVISDCRQKNCESFSCGYRQARASFGRRLMHIKVGNWKPGAKDTPSGGGNEFDVSHRASYLKTAVCIR